MLISAGTDHSVALAPLGPGSPHASSGLPGLWVWGRVGQQAVPTPVCAMDGDEHLLSAARLRVAAATEFYTWAVAAAPAGAQHGDQEEDEDV